MALPQSWGCVCKNSPTPSLSNRKLKRNCFRFAAKGQPFFKNNFCLTVFSGKTSDYFIISHRCYSAIHRSCVPVWEHALKSNKQKAACLRGAASRQAGWAKREEKQPGNEWDTLAVWWAKATEEPPASASRRVASSGQQLPGSAKCKQWLRVTQQERKTRFWEGRQCLSHQVGVCFL